MLLLLSNTPTVLYFPSVVIGTTVSLGQSMAFGLVACPTPLLNGARLMQPGGRQPYCYIPWLEESTSPSASKHFYRLLVRPFWCCFFFITSLDNLKNSDQDMCCIIVHFMTLLFTIFCLLMDKISHLFAQISSCAVRQLLLHRKSGIRPKEEEWRQGR
jgi:hypothetical protein